MFSWPATRRMVRTSSSMASRPAASSVETSTIFTATVSWSRYASGHGASARSFFAVAT